MTPQARVNASLARLAQQSSLWRAAIPLISVRVTRQAHTTAVVGDQVRINPQFVTGLTPAETDTILANAMGGIPPIRDILNVELRA
jgi:hypothetical protein